MATFEQRTEIEEVYCDLDRVVATLDILNQELRGQAAGSTLELLRGKVWDSARRLEALGNGGTQ